MDCCNNKEQKRSWLLPVVVVVLLASMMLFRQFNVFTIWPLAMIVICPLIHGLMFIFVAKASKKEKNSQA